MKNIVRSICHFTVLCLIFTQLITIFLPLQKASALAASDWNPARIIDDSIFFNPNAMNSQEIQNFLNGKLTTCDNNGALQYSYQYNTTTGSVDNPADPWVTTSRATYGQRYDNWRTAQGKYTKGATAPYTCLKDFTQNIPGIGPDAYCPGSVGAGVKSAATIIKEVAVACNINPQVILITLQKEQGLITDDWPWLVQYTKATGQGCPDSPLGIGVDANQNGCYDQYEGFFKQIYYGARQFQMYVKNPGGYNYAIGRNSFISYQANNPSCGGTNITPQTQATAALYNYTPYQPNQSALNNLYGSGDSCAAYGNRNFWRDFTGWFGSTTSTYNNIALINKGPNLASGSRLAVGDYLLSPGGNNVLTLQADGNLVLYRSGVAVWTSGTAGRPAVYAEMQADGNLVVYSDYTATWSSSTVGNINATLKMQADGNLVIYSSSGSALWNTSTDLTQAQKDQVYSKLPTGTLYAEQKLESPNKKYKMVLQTDGNLVVYSPTKAIWNSRTWGTAVKRLDMQPDGNLVLYDQNKKPLWNTSTWGKGASRLVMQDDGNLVVYSASGVPTWYTNTVGQ